MTKLFLSFVCTISLFESVGMCYVWGKLRDGVVFLCVLQPLSYKIQGNG